MIRILYLFLLFLGLATARGGAQTFIKTADLFKRTADNSHTGQLNIFHDRAVDTLLSRYILISKSRYKENNNQYGMEGFRIQIYASSNRNAREESNKANAEFISKFPDVKSYQLYAEPGYFKVRVGDFRTKTEATRLFLIISKEFPDAYLVPGIINFPDLNKK